MTGPERPNHVARSFEGAEDHYDAVRWERYFDGFDLDAGHGFIECSECGQNLHVYSADREDPGYNEMVAGGYIVFDSKAAICGGCLYEAFEPIRDAVSVEGDDA